VIDPSAATAQDAYERLVKDHLALAFRAKGFEGSGATYHRRVGQDWQVLNLQKSPFCDRGEVSFTINLGVGRADRPPAQHRCQAQARIGFAGGGDYDVWWDLGPGDDLARVAARVLDAFETVALPWFGRAR
jgi:hypothetical protein